MIGDGRPRGADARGIAVRHECRRERVRVSSDDARPDRMRELIERGQADAEWSYAALVARPRNRASCGLARDAAPDRNGTQRLVGKCGAHEGTGAAASLEITLVQQLIVRAEYRKPRNVELGGERARGWYALARPKQSGKDRPSQSVIDLPVQGDACRPIDRDVRKAAGCLHRAPLKWLLQIYRKWLYHNTIRATSLHRMSSAAVATAAGEHDFDFLHGTWKVHNRKRAPLASSANWSEFEATATERPLWGGLANIEEYEAELSTGALRGLALRLWNPVTREWTIHWSASTYGTLDVPMTGRFIDGVGTFYAQDRVNGRTVFVRFIWTSIDANACRWEQAFSADGGGTWETNWIMNFTRSA
jgi:hypothetical protein